MSVVFDRAASFYDRTRALPQQAESWLAQALREQTALQPGSRVLEIGVGTGRIALPLIHSNQYRYTGIDLSRTMMEALRAKLGDVPIALIQGDIAALPLDAGTFDAIVAVHVFHLVSAWSQGMDEVRRVLRPGGMLLHGHNRSAGESAADELKKRISSIAKSLSTADNASPTERLDHPQIAQALEQRFGPPREVATPFWQVTRTPREIIDAIEARCWSHTWALSDAVLAQTVAEGRRWALERFGSLDAPIREEQQFVWDVYRLPMTR
ncbi:MAG TPA: class I SAM-dependent methyltransferase [Herpetosiphonaceae bacterium]